MQLQLKPYHKNEFDLDAFLIRGASPRRWILEIQRLKLAVEQVLVYPVPGLQANTVWGCMILPREKIQLADIGLNEWCQHVSPHFYIAEKTILYPHATTPELERLAAETIHIFHPEFGLAALTEQLDFEQLLIAPTQRSRYVRRPTAPVFIPTQVKSILVKPVPPEEVLKNMEEHLFPKQQPLPDKPLNIFEKGKLSFYKTFLRSKESTDGKGSVTGAKTSKEGFLDRVGSWLGMDKQKEDSWINRMHRDFDDLEKRNQKQLDKLMDLFKNDPDEALKYAIPLDFNSANRGMNNGQLDWSKRWGDFSLFGNNFRSGGGGGSINLGDGFFRLQQQYTATAEELIKQGKYEKAAFVYLKLLQNYHMAAKTLEDGKFYKEAAIIYIKHCNNKQKAAECYEKGKMIQEAISIYQELNDYEKVGDLYMSINNKKEARVYYLKTVDEYKSKNQFIKASLIYRHKLHEPHGAQDILLQGWKDGRDEVSCLNGYYSNIRDEKELWREISRIYKADVKGAKVAPFLRVLQLQYAGENDLHEPIKELAYTLIAENLDQNPLMAKELKAFNPNDRQLQKDAIRFSMNRKK